MNTKAQENTNEGLTRERQRKILEASIARMTEHCETDFKRLEAFNTIAINRFLAWIQQIDEQHRLEAALSIATARLRLPNVKCNVIDNCDRWVELYRATPLNSGLDLKWRPKQHAKEVIQMVHERLSGLSGTTQSPNFRESGPLAIAGVRGGLELNTRVADIVVVQFFQEERSLFDISYLSVMALGPTAWKIHNMDECARAIAELPSLVVSARDVV